MKNILILLASAILLTGCTGQNGSQGPSGPQGTSGPYTYQASLQNGVYQNGTYAGETDTWFASTGGNGYSNAYRRVSTGANALSYSRVILKFNLSSIPTNSTIISAELVMRTLPSTSIGSSPVTIGCHNFISNEYSGGCTWNTTATWQNAWTSVLWANCSGDGSVTQAYYQNPAFSTVTFTTATANPETVSWSIPASVVQSWLTENNNDGLILKSEGEFNEPTANVDFSPYDDATPTNNPTLNVLYQ